MRLLALVNPALATLARGVAKRKGLPEAVEIAAAREILDRAGLAAEIQTSGATSIQLVVVAAGAPLPALETQPGAHQGSIEAQVIEAGE
jgi:hypothetical protein